MEQNWSNFVYTTEGGWYENQSNRYINCFEDQTNEDMFKLWVDFAINDGENITFNLLYDMADFIISGKGTYNDFTGTNTIDKIMGL